MNLLKYCAVLVVIHAFLVFSVNAQASSDSVPAKPGAQVQAVSDSSASKISSAKKKSASTKSKSKSKAKGKAAAASSVPAAIASGNGASAKAPQSSKDTLIINARLIKIPGKLPPNDLYNYVYIMKYKVLSVVKGTYTGEEILVGHYNPLIPRKKIKDKMASFTGGDIDKFETGSKQRLVLITPIGRVWDDAVEDEYIDSDLPKYYALKADFEK